MGWGWGQKIGLFLLLCGYYLCTNKFILFISFKNKWLQIVMVVCVVVCVCVCVCVCAWVEGGGGVEGKRVGRFQQVTISTLNFIIIL